MVNEGIELDLPLALQTISSLVLKQRCHDGQTAEEIPITDFVEELTAADSPDDGEVQVRSKDRM